MKKYNLLILFGLFFLVCSSADAQQQTTTQPVVAKRAPMLTDPTVTNPSPEPILRTKATITAPLTKLPDSKKQLQSLPVNNNVNKTKKTVAKTGK